jgi:ABC-type uncharacterized transport system substrate-binding protein
MADPVGDDLVANLARPGGNATGTTFLGPELVPKRLQLLRDIVPGLTRVAALLHPHENAHVRYLARWPDWLLAHARLAAMLPRR